jgi:serine/threonine-protein kinase
MTGTVRPPPGGSAPARSIPTSTPALTPIESSATHYSIGNESPPPVSIRSSMVSASDAPLVCPTCNSRYPAEFRVCPKDATELKSATAVQIFDELVGQTIGGTYTILRVVGEGGMGRVYEAQHVRIKNKRFAIKMLHPEFTRHAEVLSRFSHEAEAAGSIRNPHVVEVYDVDQTEDGRPYMVGEFLDGRELADYLLEAKKMPVGAAVHVVRQLCRGLGAAHDLGIVHRDMKPENVFLTGDLVNDPVAKIIDFGISKSGDKPGSQLTKTGMIMGTPSFMAPEQARGEKVTHLCDVYAVGAILYTLLTGQRPFDRRDSTATLTAVLLEDPPRPRSLDATIPDGLEAIIQKSMSKRADDRYQSLRELEHALAPYDDPARSTGRALALSSPGSALHSAGGADLDAASARPAAILFGALALFLGIGGLLTLVSGLVRVVRGSGADANLSGGEAAALVLLVIAALTAPIVLLVLHVKKTAWDNTARVLDLAQILRTPVLVGLSAYGFGSLLVRVIETVLLRRAVGASWPVWDLLMVLFAAGATGAVVRLRRSR